MWQSWWMWRSWWTRRSWWHIRFLVCIRFLVRHIRFLHALMLSNSGCTCYCSQTTIEANQRAAQFLFAVAV